MNLLMRKLNICNFKKAIEIIDWTMREPDQSLIRFQRQLQCRSRGVILGDHVWNFPFR